MLWHQNQEQMWLWHLFNLKVKSNKHWILDMRDSHALLFIFNFRVNSVNVTGPQNVHFWVISPETYGSELNQIPTDGASHATTQVSPLPPSDVLRLPLPSCFDTNWTLWRSNRRALFSCAHLQIHSDTWQSIKEASHLTHQSRCDKSQI